MRAEAGMLIRIRDQIDTLTPVNQRIAAYVLKNPEGVVNMSIRELAQESRASDAAVMRFCKALNIPGYRQFIVGLSTTLGAQKDTQPQAGEGCRPGNDISSILRSVSCENRQSIEDTLRVLSESELEKAMALLQGAQRVFFYGIGISALVAMDAEQKFTRMGYACHAYTNRYEQMASVALLQKNDVAVVISHSGETPEIVEVLPMIQGTGAGVIGMTRRRDSALERAADVLLSFSAPMSPLRPGTMGSRIAMLNIVDILYECLSTIAPAGIAKKISQPGCHR